MIENFKFADVSHRSHGLHSCSPYFCEVCEICENTYSNAYFCAAMMVEILKSKIHRVKITEANLHYIGSITIDEALMEAAGIIEHEKVQVVAIESGARLETYVIKGTRGSRMICMNGPASRLVQVGDTVIIMAFATMDFEEAKAFKPSVIFPKEDNTL